MARLVVYLQDKYATFLCLPPLSVVTVRTLHCHPQRVGAGRAQTNNFRDRFCDRSEETSIFTNLKLISFLKLVGVLVLAVVHLLSLDVGVHSVFLYVSSAILRCER